MNSIDVLTDAFGRIPDILKRALDGADHAALTARLDPEANTLAWLAWHTGREQDAQIAELAGTDEVWVSDGWAERAGLDLPDTDMGYGHTAEQVAKVREINAKAAKLEAEAEHVAAGGDQARAQQMQGAAATVRRDADMELDRVQRQLSKAQADLANKTLAVKSDADVCLQVARIDADSRERVAEIQAQSRERLAAMNQALAQFGNDSSPEQKPGEAE